MKGIAIIIFFVSSTNCFSQREIKLTTEDIGNIAINFGTDSALKIIEPFSDVYLIDTSIALTLALKCKDLKYSQRQFDFFCATGQKIKNQAFIDTSFQIIHSYQNSFLRNIRNENCIIPDEYFHILTFQKNILIAQKLKGEFFFWEHQSDSVRRQYPSKKKRFFQSFKGTPQAEVLYGNCRENSYKIAWALYKLGIEGFTPSRVDSIRQELVAYHSSYDMERTKSLMYSNTKTDTFKLSKPYSSLTEIDFDKEKCFSDKNFKIDDSHCWRQIIINKNLGLYETGCQYAPLAGTGRTLKIELVKPNMIVATIIAEWIS